MKHQDYLKMGTQRSAGILFLALLVFISGNGHAADRIAGRDFATRSEVIAPQAMAATSHPLTAQIALDIRALVAGGTPISAQAATHLLAVVNAVPRAPTREPRETLLTPRELDVLTMFSRGLSYRETADTLSMSTHTVTDHVKAIYTKMAVHSRNEAVFEAVQKGWLEL